MLAKCANVIYIYVGEIRYIFSEKATFFGEVRLHFFGEIRYIFSEKEVRYFFTTHSHRFFFTTQKVFFSPFSPRRENEDGGRDVKRTSQILSWWNMDYVGAF